MKFYANGLNQIKGDNDTFCLIGLCLGENKLIMKTIVILVEQIPKEKILVYANVKSVTKTEGIGERKSECKLNEANYLLFWLLILIM